MKYKLLILLALFACGQVYGFEPEPTVIDTIHLGEIITYSDHIKYQPGSKIVSFGTEQLSSAGTAGIDQLLMRHTPIYIKSDAGGLSTIRIRGTGPDHTTINYGGINLNLLTLGHSNMSKIPVIMFDRIDLQYGGSSAINGSGAIGGTIYLGNINRWTKGVKTELTTQQGSFGEQLYGAKVFVGNGRLESATRMFSYQKENNFTFKNRYTGNVENREPVTDTQKGAAVKNMGIMQEINYLFSPDNFFKSSVWVEKDWNQIQPNMQTNYRYKSTEELLNQHIRAWSEYKNGQSNLKYTLGAGYVHDYQLYNNIENQTIITNRAISEVSVKYPFNSKSEIRLGSKYQYIVPNVYSYLKENISNEQHIDIYLSGFMQPTARLKTTLNMRQMLVSNYKVPFTPALGAEYTLMSGLFHLTKINGNISRSYRIPTFNDRFWADLGNPNLKPEDGLNVETGLVYHYCNGNQNVTSKVNGYYMDIDNWIEWRNFGVWKASNVQRVVSKGIEASFVYHFESGKTQSDITLNYSFNKAEKIENKADGTVFQHQLIYTPLQSGNVAYQLKYDKFTFYLDGAFIGERYSDYLGSKISPYFLTNTGGSYRLAHKGQEISFTFAINNLFNVSYENEKYYAMPGINFRAGISLIIQTIIK
jgi:vitamin B12 transporter